MPPAQRRAFLTPSTDSARCLEVAIGDGSPPLLRCLGACRMNSSSVSSSAPPVAARRFVTFSIPGICDTIVFTAPGPTLLPAAPPPCRHVGGDDLGACRRNLALLAVAEA